MEEKSCGSILKKGHVQRNHRALYMLNLTMTLCGRAVEARLRSDVSIWDFGFMQRKRTADVCFEDVSGKNSKGQRDLQRKSRIQREELWFG